jgi:hypothetical protein
MQACVELQQRNKRLQCSCRRLKGFAHRVISVTQAMQIGTNISDCREGMARLINCMLGR